MSKSAEQLAKSLFLKENLQECTIQELKLLINKYPYFGPAHFLLAEKLKNGNAADYTNQVNKTLLYFNDPLWFDYLVNNTGNAEIIPAKKEIIKEVSIEKNIAEREPKETKTALQTKFEIPSLHTAIRDNALSEMTFEPYHTVDYFASQGIKFKEEEKPTDRFGQQLKSFTDWLKTMKKLPEPGGPGEPNISIEREVEKIAEQSIEDRNVITEAMAEVWEKQGNMEKAIAIYHKLSLHNPAKSLYFASKIEQLKKIN